jgi:FkbM family methyltransferase
MTLIKKQSSSQQQQQKKKNKGKNSNLRLCCGCLLYALWQACPYLVAGLVCGAVIAVVLRKRPAAAAHTNNISSSTAGTTTPPLLTKLLEEQQQKISTNNGLTKKELRGGTAVTLSKAAAAATGGGIGGTATRYKNCTLPPGSTVASVSSASFAGGRSGSARPAVSFELVVFDNDFLSTKIRDNGYWEIEDIGRVAELAPITQTMPTTSTSDGGDGGGNSVLYDVGANVGYYTFLFAATAGYRVVAIEPNPAAVALLRASLCLNPTLRGRISVHHLALTNPEEVAAASTATKTSSNVKDGFAGAAAHCRLVAHVKSKRVVKYLHSIPRLICPAPAEPCDPVKDLICVDRVPVTTLDQFIALQQQQQNRLPPPTFIKIDVEGHEYQVLQGAVDTLRQRRPMVQYENKDGRVGPAIEALFTSANYVVGTKRGHDANTVAEYNQNQNSSNQG